MRIMKVDGNYRILADGEHLPDEVPQDETDMLLDDLMTSLQGVANALREIHRHDVVDDMVADLMAGSNLDYDDGREWHLDCLIGELERLQDDLAKGDDDIPSYEDSETVLDAGYRTEWYGCDNGIYTKVLEDTDEREVVEEVILTLDEPVYRRRTITWEAVASGRHSKDITYDDLPIDERMARLIRNTQAMRATR